ncbi:MAG: leucine-rich repeat protein [Oscillospiraceae bacterium]|nr:leucine-rich repeat protein [Oscillospiraceae bacterium]
MRTTRFSLLLAVCFLAFTLFPGFAPPALAAEAVPPAALGDCGAFDWEVLRLTNVERAAAELPPLSVFPALQQAANLRAEEVDYRYHVLGLFSHDRPDGSSYLTVLDEFGLDYAMVGENIACLQTSPAEVVTDWMNSPGHRKNILTGAYVHGGMSYRGDGWEQLFLTGSACAYDGISILPGPEGFRLGQGKALAQLGAAVRLHCVEHGDCWLPLSDELCPGADTSQLGTVRVDVVCAGLNTSFALEIVENHDGTYTEGDFTAEVRDGKATLTAWLGSSSWYSRPAVTVPDSIAGFPVVALGPELFAEAYLSAVTLPEGLEEIGERAFSACALPEITFPAGLKRIGEQAFYFSGLRGTVSLPASLIQMGNFVFSYCSGISAFQVEEGNEVCCAVDGALYNWNQTVLRHYPAASSASSYTVPDTVTALDDAAFAMAKHLEQIYLYSPAVRAGSYTFYADDCTVWCRPETRLYAQLQSGQMHTDAAVRPLPFQQVSAAPDAIEITLADDFTGGRFLLAAYSAGGQLLAALPVSGTEAADYVLPGTARTATVRLYRLDANYAPTAETETLWTR